MDSIFDQGRKSWIDSLRALAILLVIYGHLIRGVSEYYIFTGPVKMPLFFAISGYLFKMRDGESGSFFRNLVKKLIIPWFCLALIVFPPKLFMGASVLEFVGNLISGKSLWFMPCFVIAEVIHFFVRKFTKNDYQIAIVCILLTVLGIFLHSIDILDYAMINRAFSVQFFFLIGYLFKIHEKSFVGLSWGVIFFGGLLYFLLIFLSLFLFPKSSIDVHLCRYYNYPLCFALIIIGLVVSFTASAKSDFSNRLLSMIGQNTLVLYIWHGSIIWVLNFFMDYYKIRMGSLWLDALVKTICIVAICVILSSYLNRYVPELVGKPRKTR